MPADERPMSSDAVLRRLAQADPARNAVPDARATQALLQRVLAVTPEREAGPRFRGNAQRSGFERAQFRGNAFSSGFAHARSRGARALWVGLALAPAIAIAYLALSGLRSAPRNTPNPRQVAAKPLSSILGVLRGPTITPTGRLLRAQVTYDTWGSDLRLYSQVVPRVHFATRAPWGGAGVYVVEPPIDGAPRHQGAPPASIVDPELRSDPRARQGVVLAGPSPGDPNPQFYGALTIASVEAGQALFVQAQSSPRFQGRETGSGERLLAVVPDGVAEVRFILPRQPLPIYGAPVYRSSEPITVRVRNNVAVAFVDRPCCWRTSETLNSNVGPAGPYGTAMVWLAGDGHVIRTAGDLAHTDTVTRTPIPGPETALSRAAERDPATPNPIEVTPAVGGPNTIYRLRFRALLNGADYVISSTMVALVPHFDYEHTSCVHEVSAPGGSHPNLVRGAVLNAPLVRPNQVCPGTYRVTVAVADLGFPGDYRPTRGRPFGSATVVVRRPNGG